MKTKTRYLDIDFIRAVGTIGVIFTHVLALHLGPTTINILWNYIHFVVVGFIFCSSYVYAAANPVGSIQHAWVKNFVKRFQRLYIPFVLYLLFHYSLWIIFPSWFGGFGLQRSLSFKISSVTLLGGVDIGWLPLLFIQLALVAPLLLAAARRLFLRNILLVVLGIFILVTTFWRIPPEYSRAMEWIPWSWIALLAYVYSDTRKNNPLLAHRYLVACIGIASITWIILYSTLIARNLSVTLTLHKYPPDLFYFTYGISITGVLLLLFKKIETSLSGFQQLIILTSKRAYMIFFLHYIILDAIITQTRWSWWQESIVITFLSIIIAYIWDTFETKKLRR